MARTQLPQDEQRQPAGDSADSDASAATAAAAAEARAGESGDAGKAVHELGLRDEHVSALVGLELPFYATSIERVLETVGGMDNVQQTHESKNQFLSVKLRPTEPSCKPLFADLAKTQTILLRVSRRKRKQRAEKTAGAATHRESEQGQQGGDSVDAEIIGLVREKYVCEGMADFQYFTSRTFYPSSEDVRPAAAEVAESEQMQAQVAIAEPVDIEGSVCKGSAEQTALKASLRPYLRVQSESELEMIPEVFSKVDLPLKYEFRQRSGYQPTETVKKTSSTMTYLNFHDDVPAPAEPKPENPVVRRRPVGANDAGDDHVLRILQEKLAQKPIWLRPKLFVGLDFLERRAARRLLRKLCYVFVDGPWRGSWIRMGYDPRKSSDSAKYQVIELRNNRELVHAKVTHPSRKRTKKFSGINPKGPRIVKVTQTSENENAQASKRRRKERFLLSETRRAYLADADAQQSEQQVHLSDGIDGGERDRDVSNGWDSENEQDLADDGNDAASVASSATSATRADEDGASSVHSAATTSTVISASAATTGSAGAKSGERTYEIFGVPLTSANVLFQLDEIDDDEVRAWTSQFAMQDKPTLLGGWFSTHMFLPLREIVRFRIAALVGRSKADLDTRRKRIEALKKQALAESTDQASSGSKGASGNGGGAGGEAAEAMDVTPRPEDLEQAAFEESLAREHAANGRAQNATVANGVATADAVEAVGATDSGAPGAPSVAVPGEEEEEDGEEEDDDLEFDEEDEIQEEEENAAVFERQNRLQNGGNGDGESGEDSEDVGDADGGDGDESAVEDNDKAGRRTPTLDRESGVVAPSTAAPDAESTGGGTTPPVALEYSF